MNPDEPSPAKSPPPSSGGIGGLDPAELLARALNTVQPSAGQTAWIPPEPEVLARLLPQYSIESLLGRGGMGAVYKGRQSDLDRPVAIKLLPAEIAANEEFVARFRREARMLAKLQHSGIVAIYDFGQTREGHLYFVMEFVEGTDLQKILRGPGLEPAQALNLISQVCDALHFAHSKGVIHRDIKPGNILVNTDGWVKLADFGLARPIEEKSTVLTGSHVVMGTLDYMAPEQRDRSADADQRGDIYALGVMLYEMLTGQRPHGVFDPPSHRVQVDIRLDGVVLKAMQQQPERRYQQVSEMKTDVDTIRHTPPPASGAETEPFPAAPHVRPAARPRRPVAVPHPARARTADPGQPSPDALVKTTSSHNRTLLVLGLVALLVLGGLATFLATRKNGDTYNTVQNLTWQEIQNNYFTNLITTGVTSAKDLEAITDIRPFGSLFIGVSKEPMTLPHAQELAKYTGAAILRAEDSKSGSQQELTDWLRSSYPTHLTSSAWVEQSGETKVLDSGSVLPGPKDDKARKVILQWQGPDSLLSFAKKPTAPAIDPAKEQHDLELQRKLAESILKKGGHVEIWQNTQVKGINSLTELPAGKIELYALDTYGTNAIFDDADARFMAGCNRLHHFRIHNGSMTFLPFETLPEIGGIEISGSVMTTDAFISLPQCRNLRVITIADIAIDRGITNILAECQLLEHIHIGGKQFVKKDILPLTKLKNLKHFEWTECEIGSEDGLAILVNIQTLETLRLDGLANLEGSMSFLPRMKNVRVLCLGNYAKLSRRSWLSVGSMPALNTAVLSSTNISDEDLQVFSGNKTIVSLNLSDTAITAEGFSSVLSMPNLATISIGMYQDKLSDAGVKALLKACPNIQRLDFYGQRLTVGAIAAISTAKSVEHLLLRDAKRFEDSWVPHLAAMTNLSELYVGSPAFKDVHLHQLANLQTSLAQLYLNKSGITDKCLDDLKGFKKLRELNISETKITKEGVQALKKALPECNIVN